MDHAPVCLRTKEYRRVTLCSVKKSAIHSLEIKFTCFYETGKAPFSMNQESVKVVLLAALGSISRGAHLSWAIKVCKGTKGDI